MGQQQTLKPAATAMNHTLGIQASEELYTKLPPKGPSTIHQRALLCFWLSAILLWVIKATIRGLRLSNGVQGGVDQDKTSVVENGLLIQGKDQKQNGNGFSEKSHESKASEPQTKPPAASDPTFEQFLKFTAFLGAILFYFYLCDHEHYFPAAPRVYSRDVFVFLYLVLVLVATGFTTRETQDTILNRDQTEEWKGIMQVLFVWYHYFKAAEAYNAIRVFIAAYVWMTGFGNFSFFWIRKDFSIYRVMKMMFRLNFLVLLTCVVTANQYMLYYICAMHTFWFLSVYVMMRPVYTSNADPRVMVAKFFIYAVIVFLLFDVSGVGEVVFGPFSFILKFRNSLHEWMFRAGLDHYATLLGMVCAYFHPNFEKFFAYLERDFTDRRTRFGYLFVKITIAALFLVVFAFWWRYIFILGKYDYNSFHPYFSFVPLLSYMLLRNLFPSLRARYAHLFAWLGKITLETYISQLHIYMQNNANMLIVYIPGYPLLNFAFATVLYLFISYHLFHLTINLSAYIICKDQKAMFKRYAIGIAWLGFCYVIGNYYPRHSKLIF